jgi:hypothetical protein
MRIEFEYPIFALVGDTPPCGFGILEEPGKALAIFTDLAAAEQFIDEVLPGMKPFEITTEHIFRLLLGTFTDVVDSVAFDPWRLGKQVRRIELAKLLEQLSESGHDDSP